MKLRDAKNYLAESEHFDILKKIQEDTHETLIIEGYKTLISFQFK